MEATTSFNETLRPRVKLNRFSVERIESAFEQAELGISLADLIRQVGFRANVFSMEQFGQVKPQPALSAYRQVSAFGTGARSHEVRPPQAQEHLLSDSKLSQAVRQKTKAFQIAATGREIPTRSRSDYKSLTSAPQIDLP